jgi:hypothetical protein
LRTNNRFLYFLFTFCILGGCINPIGVEVVTPLPLDFLPTAIALTLQARGVELSTLPSPATVSSSSTPSIVPPTSGIEGTDTEIATDTQTPESSLTRTQKTTVTSSPTSTESVLITATEAITGSIPFEIPLPPPPVDTPSPAIPEAHIQINRLGELSLVTSPIQAPLHLTEKNVRIVRIELYGEDGRLLARDVRNFDGIPWGASQFTEKLEFEIDGAAELSRLVVSVEDRFGRLTDVNSVNLVLLSTGMAKLNPTSALWQRIIIQEPQSKGLVQGGKLIVSGRARPNSDKPLHVMLITEDGKIVGQRLAGVTINIPGDYGAFITEVPYTVTDLIFALLVVYEDGNPISDIAHLSSVDVILAP